MIVTCPNCQTRYNLPDDKIPDGGAKVKCSKCAHVFKAELPAGTPEEEVENLFEEESQAPDTGVGDDFDETFDEVAAGGQSADEPVPDDEPVADEAESGPEESEEPAAAATPDETPADDGPDAMPDEDMPGMDDLFDDADEAPTPEEGASPTGGLDQATADDVESLFGDDEGDLFADGDDDASEDDGADDLFADDDADDSGDADDDTGDLFADDDDGDEADEDEDEEYEDNGTVGDFGLDEEPKKKAGGKSLGCLIILLVVALGLGGGVYYAMTSLDLGSYFQNVPYIGKMFMEETAGTDEAAPGESPAERVRNIELKNVKQYYVKNEKTGHLFVVEGKAINKFATPKEQIKVEVVLYDGTGQILTSQAFLCGNVLSQFQLQVQTQKEIEDGLSSEVGILSNNTFIRPGASTPFMAVFFEPPAGVKEFQVKVVNVGDPE